MRRRSSSEVGLDPLCSRALVAGHGPPSQVQALKPSAFRSRTCEWARCCERRAAGGKVSPDTPSVGPRCGPRLSGFLTQVLRGLRPSDPYVGGGRTFGPRSRAGHPPNRARANLVLCRTLKGVCGQTCTSPSECRRSIGALGRAQPCAPAPRAGHRAGRGRRLARSATRARQAAACGPVVRGVRPEIRGHRVRPQAEARIARGVLEAQALGPGHALSPGGTASDEGAGATPRGRRHSSGERGDSGPRRP